MTASALVPKPRVERAPRRAALAPLIGRDDDIGRVVAAFESGARVVTLSGPPGIGKTRAALACLERLAPRFAEAGGAWFCDLSHVTSDGGLGLAVLSLLRDRRGGEVARADEARARVGDVLEAAGPALLVLDNFEQLVSAAAVVERWCEAAPELWVLVTSRERLAVAGEVVVELAPLDDSAAAQLFVKRARDAGGAQAYEPAAVASIVRKLEGIPLAIELAAARTRLMPLADLARRLASGHGVLAKAGLRDGGRHATLASAIAWSWGLLSHDEQLALARCSVFAGSFSLEMAERVIDAPDALELVAGLRDKSLVHATEGGLALYVSIRDFAAERLRDLGLEAAARYAHARAFGDLARRVNAWRQVLGTLPDAAAQSALRRDKENLAAAVAYARELGAADLHAELAMTAAQLFAYSAETCVAELSHALASLPEHDSDRRGLVLAARQSVHASLGDYESSLADLESIEALPNVPRDLALVACVYRGIQLRHYGFPEKARDMHARAAARLAERDAPHVAAMNDACTGRLAYDLGDFDGSRAHNERAIATANALGDRWLAALALANLAHLEQELGLFERAETLLSTALERLRELGEVYEAVYTSACGDLYFEWGKHDVARTWYAESARVFQGALLGSRHAAIATAAAAALEAHDGDRVRASQLLESARRLASRSPNRVVGAAVALHGASVELLAADGPARLAAVQRWDAELAGCADATTPRGRIVTTSFEARFSLRIARRALARARAEEAPRVLRVQRAGRWFEVGGARVDLGRRGALRRILVALANHPGGGIKQTELALAGWPGERVLAEAAATRVRVAIATLRQLGLRSLLVTRDDGYVLDGASIELCD